MEATYTFQFTENHLLTAMLRYREQVWWRRPFVKYRWYIVAITGAMLVAAEFHSQILSIITGAVFGATLIGWPIDALLSRWRFRKSPYYNDNLKVTISPHGLTGYGSASKSEFQWAVFSKARRYKDGILLFQGQHIFHWLPDAAASDSSTVQTALELIQAHVSDCRDA